MPQTLHVERQFTAGEVVRHVVIGMPDGLTMPFALAAGLSGAHWCIQLYLSRNAPPELDLSARLRKPL